MKARKVGRRVADYLGAFVDRLLAVLVAKVFIGLMVACAVAALWIVSVVLQVLGFW